MASWIVMQPPDRTRDADLAFVRDGFSVFAFLVPPLWLLWHRLWIEAVAGIRRVDSCRRARAAGSALPRPPAAAGLDLRRARRQWTAGRGACGGAAGAVSASSTPTVWMMPRRATPHRRAPMRRSRPDRAPIRPSANIAGASPAPARAGRPAAQSGPLNNACRHHRLRLRQSALGDQGFRTRRARSRHRGRDRADVAGRTRAHRRPHRAAGRRRLCRLPRRARCRRRHGRGGRRKSPTPGRGRSSASASACS